MDYADRPQLPLTLRRKGLVATGAAMFLVQAIAAILTAPALTDAGESHLGAIAMLWAASVVWSVVAVLLLIRQADIPDVATASFLMTIPAFAAFVLAAAIDARGTEAETSLVDALFFGVTSGSLTALVVWGIAQGAARLLHLPTAEAMRDGE